MCYNLQVFKWFKNSTIFVYKTSSYTLVFQRLGMQTKHGVDYIIYIYVNKFCNSLELDKNNYTPSFLRSLCEIGGDCFGPRYFSEGATREIARYQSSHQWFSTITETKMVQIKVIIVINDCCFGHFCMHFKCIFLNKNVIKHTSHPFCILIPV